MWEHSELKKEIETPVLLAHAIEDSTDIFGISGGGFEPPKPPPRYATAGRTFVTLVFDCLSKSNGRFTKRPRPVYIHDISQNS